MPVIDPVSRQPLPETAIQRSLFVASDIHVYQIPPLASTRGFASSSWTSQPRPSAREIFTARLRIVETSVGSEIKVDIVLEDGHTDDLFAAAPYTNVAVVQQALDSSRFFAMRVQGDNGMKATLGLGFEDRSPALDFSVALGEARKILRMPTSAAHDSASTPLKHQDYSLKDGQKIHIQVGGKGRRLPSQARAPNEQDDQAALFSIAPPPPAANIAITRGSLTSSIPKQTKLSIADQVLDESEFGEFQ